MTRLIAIFAGFMALSSLIAIFNPSLWPTFGNPRQAAVVTFIISSIIGAWAYSRAARRY
jgi:membrane protein implicated in regulation of membrane protease activity